MADLDTVYRPMFTASLAQGEDLLGVLAATHRQSAFKGRSLAIGVTPTRILVQPLTRRGEPNGPVQPITRAEVREAKLEGAGRGSATMAASIVAVAAVNLKLRTTDGTTWKLMMMHGEGAFSGLGGGDAQRQGVQALARWLDA